MEKLKIVYTSYYCWRNLFCPQNELATEYRDIKLVIPKQREFSSEGSVNLIPVKVIKYKYLLINEEEICFLERGQNGYRHKKD